MMALETINEIFMDKEHIYPFKQNKRFLVALKDLRRVIEAHKKAAAKSAPVCKAER
jgi:hypothetical protein